MAAIKQSTYLADSFAKLREVPGDKAIDQRGIGLYLTGRETTVALFSPSGLHKFTLGQSGLGVGLDTVGETAAVREHYGRLTGLQPTAFARSQEIDGLDVPWFLSTMAGSVNFAAPPEFITWTMEYQPAYFVADKSKVAGTGTHDVSRRRYYSNHFDESRSMQDIVGLTFDVAEGDGVAAIPLLEAAGFVVARTESRVVARSDADTITINLVADDAAKGLREIVFSLNREIAEQQTEKLGASELVVGPGRRAVWQFSPYD